MLGNEESGTLLTLFKAGDDPHQPLESIVDDFKPKLHSSRHFNTCVSLALILEFWSPVFLCFLLYAVLGGLESSSLERLLEPGAAMD
ncbi:hypothetical protein DM860_017597 [Cuscuta australis]|uniref:Uncharacterized protein n=1 Tax=Cuscuta australis TaxID=267555 RepID=A0A328D9A6_9ASTE|nr:hypothetical protein DM860_017597 [Cuscuta australis]